MIRILSAAEPRLQEVEERVCVGILILIQLNAAMVQ
tara:strand:+ start:5146 stop:5253 length:108 start_codon:yes stop_codon:yes gene_type:complete